MTRYKNVTSNVVLSIGASFVPILILQFIIQPFIASRVDAEVFGRIVLAIALLNVGVSIFGNSINNARLIDNHLYSEKKGDYPIFFIVLLVISIVVIFCALQFFSIGGNFLTTILFLIALAFSVAVEYYSVEFRIQLNYKNIFFGKVALTVGYCIGTLLFLIVGSWVMIFLLGAGFEFLFCMIKTEIWKEPLIFTQNKKTTARRILFLLLTSALASTLAYVDRFLIFPLFGGSELSYYYAASIVGKAISLIAGPIAGVILSYVAQMRSLTFKELNIYMIVLALLTVLGSIVAIYLSPPIIHLLYPDFLEYSKPYISVTVITAMFGFFYSFIWPIVLRFGRNYYPMMMQGIKATAYLLSGVLLIPSFRVLGVAYASLIGSIIQVMVVVVLAFIIIIRQERELRQS
jgi:O-antigen/teichoic acid export membrane protein